MTSLSWREVAVPAPAGSLAAMDWGGVGDPVLLLHGGGSNAAEWAATVPHLVDGFRCISFDSAGHGRSPEPASRTYDALLAEVDAVVDHFGLDAERLVVVGSSFGGAVAVRWAGTPGRCRAVVGVDSAPMRRHLAPRPLGRRASHPPDYWRALGWGWSGDERGYEERVAEAVAQSGLEAQARRAHTRGPDGRYRSHPGPELLCQLESLGNRPDNPFLDVGNYARLACPTLLVCATDGTGADNRAFIDSMPGQFPAVRVVWMDGPHSLNYAHPALVADHIRRFVAAG